MKMMTEDEFLTMWDNDKEFDGRWDENVSDYEYRDYVVKFLGKKHSETYDLDDYCGVLTIWTIKNINDRYFEITYHKIYDNMEYNDYEEYSIVEIDFYEKDTKCTFTKYLRRKGE